MILLNLKVNLDSKKYQIIYADPPWKYSDRSKSHGGGAESHYPVMAEDDICAIPIPSEDNSVLLLWATYPQLEVAMRVIKAWGFIYKTCAFTWVKVTDRNAPLMGMGRYTRSNPEIVLLGIKGNGVKRINTNIRNDQYFPRREHSRKPAEFRGLIVSLFGDLPKIELFARRKVEGWDCWGNEVESDIKLTQQMV